MSKITFLLYDNKIFIRKLTSLLVELTKQENKMKSREIKGLTYHYVQISPDKTVVILKASDGVYFKTIKNEHVNDPDVDIYMGINIMNIDTAMMRLKYQDELSADQNSLVMKEEEEEEEESIPVDIFCNQKTLYFFIKSIEVYLFDRVKIDASEYLKNFETRKPMFKNLGEKIYDKMFSLKETLISDKNIDKVKTNAATYSLKSDSIMKIRFNDGEMCEVIFDGPRMTVFFVDDGYETPHEIVQDEQYIRTCLVDVKKGDNVLYILMFSAIALLY